MALVGCGGDDGVSKRTEDAYYKCENGDWEKVDVKIEDKGDSEFTDASSEKPEEVHTFLEQF